jgi:hypothetical protein
MSSKQVSIRRAKKFEDTARYYYDHGDIEQGDQYQERANRYWREGGKPQMIMSLRGSRANPLIADDWLRIGVGVALVAGLGFMFWQKSQENALSLNASAPAAPAPASQGSSYFAATATDINPGGPPPPQIPITSGGVPIPSPPTA